MPKFAANLSFLFTELPFLDRFKAARDAGFRAVEFMFPYDYKKEELAKQLHDNELALILHNLPAGNWASGFFVATSKFGFELIDAAATGNIGLQYDIYHMQVMEGNLARTIESNLSRICHIQVAENPGRHEPGTGEIDYPFLFGFIDRIGYAGWIGCEYKPSKDTVSSLGWLKGQL